MTTTRRLHFDSFLRDLDAMLHASGISRRTWAPICSADAEAFGPGSGDRPSIRVGRVVSYIDENLDASLSLDELAREAELSKFHFSRVFREEVGDPPWAYVRKARIGRAKDLLAQGVSPAAAAVESGFCDQSHLTKVMKQFEGKTPRQYQEESHRKDVQE